MHFFQLKRFWLISSRKSHTERNKALFMNTISSNAPDMEVKLLPNPLCRRTIVYICLHYMKFCVKALSKSPQKEQKNKNKTAKTIRRINASHRNPLLRLILPSFLSIVDSLFFVICSSVYLLTSLNAACASLSLCKYVYISICAYYYAYLRYVLWFYKLMARLILI